MPQEKSPDVQNNSKQDIAAKFYELVRAAKHAQQTSLELMGHDRRCRALTTCARLIQDNQDVIIAANQQDLRASADASPVFRDRLMLSHQHIPGLVSALEAVADQPDPLYQVIDKWSRPNGLLIERLSTPIGCLGIIYEARPNVTIDAAALCIKSGNAAILRPGSSSFSTSRALLGFVHHALREVGLPESLVSMTPTNDRSLVDMMLGMQSLIDLVIPRGGKKLVSYVLDKAVMPVLAHREGNCHIYVHDDADITMAINVIRNAKMRRLSVCGAMESLVVHRNIANTLLPQLLDRLDSACVVVGCAQAQKTDSRIQSASEDDWCTEYLDAKFSVIVVDGLDKAIDHINTYGSHHTDGIVCSNKIALNQFSRQVDSSIVMHNASTQYADGGEFGFGAEIGIATGTMPPRGPIGAQQLTSYRYVVRGDGHIRP